MRILNGYSLSSLAILGAIAACSANLRADDPSPVGIIRISDAISPIPEPNPLPVSSIHSGTVNGQFQTISVGTYYSSGTCSCGCTDGSCRSRGCNGIRFFNALINPFAGCTHSSDHGWVRPQKHALHRIPVQYQRYWPNKWYGQPGYGPGKNARRYPTVYMPTDTTQLGYYYQTVPQWRPNPSMLPPAPRPSQWHVRGRGQGAVYSQPVMITPTPQQAPTVPPKPTLNKSAQLPQPGLRN